MISKMEEVKQAVIYIGLNDSVTHVQKFETDKYISILKKVCKSYRTAFSTSVIDGGYFHEDGTYVEEKTLVLTLLGVDDGTVEEIARDLCAFFNQESVMVTYSQAKVHFIQEKI